MGFDMIARGGRERKRDGERNGVMNRKRRRGDVSLFIVCYIPQNTCAFNLFHNPNMSSLFAQFPFHILPTCPDKTLLDVKYVTSIFIILWNHCIRLFAHPGYD